LKGKYGYMSPEQVGGAELDSRSDLFAVAIVLAEMLMGKRLFTAQNDLDVLLMVRDGRLERFDKYGKNIPKPSKLLCAKGWPRIRTSAFRTAAEFAMVLHDLEFQFGLRVGPADVGVLASDLFDKSPEAMARLQEHSRKWEIKTDDTPARRHGAGSKPKREQAQSRRRDGDEPEETSIPIDLDDQDAGSPRGPIHRPRPPWWVPLSTMPCPGRCLWSS